MKNLIVASTSTVHGQTPLEYLLSALTKHFDRVEELLFIPYARPSGISHDEYTQAVSKTFEKIGIKVKGIHEFTDPKVAVEDAQAIFTGGGNTFELVNQLYKNNLIQVLQKTLVSGTPYLGTSAGSNICGVSMMNTNDMPIVYPPSFDTLAMIPFNINAHYMDPDPGSTHMGETRETRIKEFHVFNEVPVLGLREGSWLEVNGSEILLKGPLTARLFRQGKDPKELVTNSKITKYL